MQRLSLISLALLVSLSAAGQSKQRFGQEAPADGVYPLHLKVSHSWVTVSDGRAYLHLTASLDGYHMELAEDVGTSLLGHPLPMPGDYVARISGEQTKGVGVLRTYQVAMPNGQTENFTMIGISD